MRGWRVKKKRQKSVHKKGSLGWNVVKVEFGVERGVPYRLEAAV